MQKKRERATKITHMGWSQRHNERHTKRKEICKNLHDCCLWVEGSWVIGFSNFFTFLSPVQIFHNGHHLVRKREGRKKLSGGKTRHREVLEFLRLTLQYSSIGIRRLTATSRMWLRRKRILPAEDKSAHSVERQRWPALGSLAGWGRTWLPLVCLCVCAWSRLALWGPMDCSPLGSSVHGFSRQECLSGLPFPTPGDLPDLGIEPLSLGSPALAGGFFTTAPSGKWSLNSWLPSIPTVAHPQGLDDPMPGPPKPCSQL